MKILVPTDFSKLSKVAVKYAAKLCNDLNAELVLLHVVYFNAPSRGSVEIKMDKILDEMAEFANEDFETLLNEINSEMGAPLQTTVKVVKGYPVDEIISFTAMELGIDLIVVGTKGATGIRKVLMGSNATAIIGRSTIPVITVPEFGRYRSINHIVYASDLDHLEVELKLITNFAALLNASVSILHIEHADSKSNIDVTKLEEEMKSKLHFENLSIHVVFNDDIQYAIEEHVADTNADVIAMFTHKPTFLEKLFGTSVTRSMAFHSWVPILSLKRKPQ